MNAQVKLYRVGFNSNMNCVVDKIADYLKGTATTVITYDNVMYQKIELDMEIKLPISESLVERPDFNYVSILNQDGQRPFYFFIRDVQWLSQQGIKVLLSMDTLNTFQDLLVFSNNTKITRQHKDRFYQEYYDTQRPQLATRKIDLPSEITGLTKYKTNSTTVSGNTDLKWYLVYANDPDKTGVGDNNEPVAGYVMPSEPVKFYGLHSTYGPQYFNTGDLGDIYLIKENVTLTLTTTTNQTVTLQTTGTQTYYISTVPMNTGNYFNVIGKGDTSTQSYGCTAIGFSGLVHLAYYDKVQASELLNLSVDALLQVARNSETNIICTSSGAYTVDSINAVDRTSTSLIKIIECPYEPFTLVAKDDGYLLNDGLYVNLVSNLKKTPVTALKLDNLTQEFLTSLHNYSLSDFTCIIPLAADRQYAKKNIEYESKLYHSDFHNIIFNYDSFTKDIALENITPSSFTDPKLSIDYKQANTITSNLGFKFTVNGGTQKTNDVFAEYLLCNRNNESQIFNSSYLNYLRNGYNYDAKAKTLQAAQSWMSAGISIAGGIASVILGATTSGVSTALGVSLITGAISSLTSNIFSYIQSEENLEQKLNEAKNTTNSVKSSDDLNLLNWYSDNKLLATTYDLSDTQKNNVFELFYKTGYACNETGIPNVTSRYRFNYLQCTPDFTTKANSIWQEYINDVIARFELGVTYFHTYHDFEQQYENWESWLMA